MIRVLLVAVVLVALSGSPAVAQQVTAEVRTWSGQSLTLTDATFEVFYTIMPSVTAALGGGGGPGGYTVIVPGSGGAPTPPGASGELAQPPATIGVGTVGFQSGTAMQAASGTLLPQGPASKQGRRQQEIVTLFRQGVETQVPVANIASLAFTRSDVKSPLPPYASGAHFRHAVTATLTDGSKIEADYVNLGTALLRGTAPQGRIDIPWDAIESIAFRR
jgi:hypothetical protein